MKSLKFLSGMYICAILVSPIKMRWPHQLPWASPQQTELAVNTSVEDPVASNQKANKVNNESESKGSIPNSKASIEVQTTDLIETQDVLTNSINPQPNDGSTNSSNNPLARQSEQALQETIDAEIAQNLNTDETQSISSPSNDPSESLQNDSNINNTRETIADNSISVEAESVNNNEVKTMETLALESSGTSSEDSELESTKVPEGNIKENDKVIIIGKISQIDKIN